MKQKLARRIVIKTLICMSVLTISQAQAAMVQFTLNGEITRATNPNVFDVLTNDIITVTGQFDNSLIGSGETIIDFSTIDNNMQISIGNTVYTDEMDIANGAYMYFVDSVFDGIDYEAIDGRFDSWGTVGGQLESEDFTGTGIAGNWTVSSFQVAAVPVPAAVWLFGSGLTLLAGFARHKQAMF